MVPPTIVLVDAIPRSASGKRDRSKLPVPDAEDLVSPAASTHPRTPEEKRLAAVWQDVLGVARVGITDDIFDLGGDSLLIFQIATRASEAGVAITPRQLFEHRTIAGVLLAVTAEATAPRRPPIRPRRAFAQGANDGVPVSVRA